MKNHITWGKRLPEAFDDLAQLILEGFIPTIACESCTETLSDENVHSAARTASGKASPASRAWTLAEQPHHDPSPL